MISDAQGVIYPMAQPTVVCVCVGAQQRILLRSGAYAGGHPRADATCGRRGSRPAVRSLKFRRNTRVRLLQAMREILQLKRELITGPQSRRPCGCSQNCAFVETLRDSPFSTVRNGRVEHRFVSWSLSDGTRPTSRRAPNRLDPEVDLRLALGERRRRRRDPARHLAFTAG